MAGGDRKRVLYVGGLEKEVDEKILYAAFIPFGPIKEVQIPMNFQSNTHKGFGFVEYEEEDDAKEALDNMEDSELFGKVLRVTVAKADRPTLGSDKPIWAEKDQFVDLEAEENDAENENTNGSDIKKD